MVDAAAMAGEALGLSGPGISLRFGPGAPPATADIFDRAWRLEAMTERPGRLVLRARRAFAKLSVVNLLIT